MYFKRIEIQGFKSFAEHTVIEFDRGITCVVGPNGSGKSNVCDAIRWVLGTQSPKMLRGDKMEDVIFAGSTGRRAKGMAQVSLIIDNSTGLLPIDYSEVVLTRRMYRSGETEYLINNSRCRMKDIRALTMDTGIGVEGYSIVGQGEISGIVSNNSDSIREIIEETAGVVTYRSKKAEAERKLSSASSNLERVNDIVGELSRRLPGLKEDRVKAEEYLKLSERHRELEINLILNNLESIKVRTEYIRNDILDIEGTIEEKLGEKREQDRLIEKKSNERKRIEDEGEGNRKSLVAVMEALSELEGDRNIRLERINSLRTAGKRLEEDLQDIEVKIQREKVDLEELNSSREDVAKRLDTLKDELSETLDIHSEDIQAMNTKEEEINALKDKLVSMEVEMERKATELRSVVGLIETLETRQTTLREEVQSVDMDVKPMEDGISSLESDIRRVQDEMKKFRSERDDAKKELVRLTEEAEGTKKLVNEINMDLGRLITRKKTLEEMESSYEGFSGSVKFVMNLKFSGIEGVVSDLIDAHKGYEIALETALGGSIQNVVCENDNWARQAIEMLKKHRAGRLTFLPIDSINPRKYDRNAEIEGMAGFEGYGTECADYSSRHGKIIEYLLGNVLIFDNMENAIPASKKMGRASRIVTLDGDIINGGGAITGGKHRNKINNILERKVEIRQLGEDIDEKESDLKVKKDQLFAYPERLTGLKGKVAEMTERLELNEAQYHEKNRELSILREKFSGQEAKLEKYEEEMKNLKVEMDKGSHTISGIEGEIGAKGTEKELAEKLLADLMNKQEEMRTRLNTINAGITDKRVGVAEMESEVTKLNALISKAEDRVEILCMERHSKSEECNVVFAEAEKLKASIGETDRSVERKKIEKVDLERRMEEIDGEKKKIRGEEEIGLEQRDEIGRRIETMQREKHEYEIRRTKLEAQLENSKNKLWEDFEVSYLQAIDFKKEDFVPSKAVKENREIKNRIKELGDINVGAIEEYEEVNERHQFLTEQRDDIVKSKEGLQEIIRDMDKITRHKFKETFDQVVDNFKDVFRELYGGGEANISLVDDGRPMESEIEITAQPPGKHLKHINLLSGGEKTMTAISLMFAVLKTKPTPCCILDEVEAALDDSNLEIFGEYLRTFGGVQFTLITHQKTTMEHADVMYGITMPEGGISKIYSLKMEKEQRQQQ